MEKAKIPLLKVRYPSEDLNTGLWANGGNDSTYLNNSSILSGQLHRMWDVFSYVGAKLLIAPE